MVSWCGFGKKWEGNVLQRLLVILSGKDSSASKLTKWSSAIVLSSIVVEKGLTQKVELIVGGQDGISLVQELVDARSNICRMRRSPLLRNVGNGVVGV